MEGSYCPSPGTLGFTTAAATLMQGQLTSEACELFDAVTVFRLFRPVDRHDSCPTGIKRDPKDPPS
jgi:hypothetical protein